jgi:hypothetical protein
MTETLYKVDIITTKDVPEKDRYKIYLKLFSDPKSKYNYFTCPISDFVDLIKNLFKDEGLSEEERDQKINKELSHIFKALHIVQQMKREGI